MESAPRQISFRYDLSAAKDVPVTMVIASLGVEKVFAKGKLALSHADGTEATLNLPFPRGGQPTTAKAVLSIENVGDIGITLDPPCPISFDGDMRIVLASDVFKQGERSITITLTLPGETAFLAKQTDLDRLTRTLAGPDWFPFTPADDVGPSVISMNDWLDQPAGKHGGVRMVGDHFEFADDTPVKFWGVNLSYGGGCAPEKKDAEFTAARYAKYGINGVRLHKFTYPKNQMGIGDPNDATRMDPDGLDRLDYFAAQLKTNGVYFGWSHTFKFQVSPGNRNRLVAYDEIAQHLKGDTYAFINFAEDVQDLMIEMVVNLLKHKNPYTGLTYAAEPALSFIELQNEDDIFFWTSEQAFNACPTYQQALHPAVQRLAQGEVWHRRETQAGVGRRAQGRRIAGRPQHPAANQSVVLHRRLSARPKGRPAPAPARQRRVSPRGAEQVLLPVRESHPRRRLPRPVVRLTLAGAAMLPHYYNLRSDYLVGYIDRHNYFGEGLFDSLLAQPGSGYFSSGLQQVVDRPFGLSEWITVYPSLYSADGPALIAAYGLGLQGWDCSYEFQSQSAHRLFSDRAGWPPWGVWEADVPTQIGQFPALARMIYRGDVKEAPVISTRRVSPDALATGTFNFTDKVVQQGDIKSFGGSVPPEALAVGRVVVEFTDKEQPSTFPDLAPYRAGTALASATKQLVWDTAGQGWFTVDTPGTKAVVGFAGGKTVKLGDITIAVASPYASIFLTALARTETLATAKSALLTAVARNCNTGFKYFAPDSKVLDNGKPPILLEPVRATITISGRKVTAVNILDHNGRRTGKTLPVKNGQFTINGAQDKALYYKSSSSSP